MIILLDSSTMTCKLTLIIDEQTYSTEWEAARGLAKGLLAFLRDEMLKHGKTWSDISGIGVNRGPGSFTGLRIGAAVLNTIADSESIPIVGESGENWQAHAVERLMKGENDRIVLPEYGREARITTPRK